MGGGEDRCDDGIEAVEDIRGGDAQDAIPLAVEDGRTAGVSVDGRVGEVLGAVHFDDETRPVRREVGEVATNRDLAAKVERFQRLLAKGVP